MKLQQFCEKCKCRHLNTITIFGLSYCGKCNKMNKNYFKQGLYFILDLNDCLNDPNFCEMFKKCDNYKKLIMTACVSEF